jgi:uncharacterized protein YciI
MHFHGRNVQKLHPNHLAFLKELNDEAELIARGKALLSWHASIDYFLFLL